MTLRKMPESKYWIFQCKVGGKTFTRSTGETDKRRALAKVAELRLLAESQRELPPSSRESSPLSKAIVREVARLEVDVSPQASERCHYALINFAAWLGKDRPLEKIDAALIEAFQRKRLREVALSTVKREVGALLRMLRQNGFEVKKPSPKPGKSVEQRDFTKAELARFFEHCTEDQRTLFQFLLATGARPAEVVPSSRSSHKAILKSELDGERCLATIRSAKLKPGQKPKTRVVAIPQDLMERTLELAGRTPGPFVFASNVSLGKLFDRILIRAGLATEIKIKEGDRVKRRVVKTDELGRKVTAHSFRHTFGTLAAEALGGNPFLLKEAMGHAKIEMSAHYCHAAVPAMVVDMSELVGMGVRKGCKAEKKNADSKEVGALSPVESVV